LKIVCVFVFVFVCVGGVGAYVKPSIFFSALG